MDERTDRIPLAITALSIASNADALQKNLAKSLCMGFHARRRGGADRNEILHRGRGHNFRDSGSTDHYCLSNLDIKTVCEGLSSTVLGMDFPTAGVK